MKLIVKVKPAAKIDNIEKIDDNNFVVSVKEPPVKGRANVKVISLLADYFSVANKDVSILAGHFRRQKIININLTKD